MATKVTLAGKEYTYAFDLGAMMHFERIMAQIGKDATTTEVAAASHYACLLGDKTFTLSVDDFYAAVDSMDVLNALNVAHAAERARWDALNSSTENTSSTENASKKK